MPPTTIRGQQVLDGTIQRHDLDTTTVGQSVIAKILQGTNVTLSSTGGDSGTGDVTVSAPVATATTAGVVPIPPNNTSTFLRGDATFADPTPTITSVRLRSFNAIGNPSVSEVDQRNVHAAVNNPVNNTYIRDRWFQGKAGTMAVNFTSMGAGPTDGLVPGTNFRVCTYYERITLATQETTLGSGDYLMYTQRIEGPQWRELILDVHSVSLLVRCSSALKFGLVIRDSANAWGLCSLCTITNPNTWTLVQIPNLPVFTTSGSYNLIPGNQTGVFLISLCAGSSQVSSSNGVWINSGPNGAVGQDNFAALAVNSTFDIAFVQHEPGPQCTTLIDKPYPQNYDECLRYYQKSYDYQTAIGTITASGVLGMVAPTALAVAYGSFRYAKPMAKNPTVTFYNHATGAANSVRDNNAVDHASTAAVNANSSGFSSISFTTATAAAMAVYAHYTADTGW